MNIEDGNVNGSVAYECQLGFTAWTPMETKLESDPTCDTCGGHDSKEDTTKQTHNWREEKRQNNNIELGI